MRQLLIATTVVLSLLAKPASAESRADAVSAISDQIEMMMAVCGVAPTDQTKSNIARRVDEDDFDPDHFKVLVLAAIAASSRAVTGDDDGDSPQFCTKWREVFIYAGAIR